MSRWTLPERRDARPNCPEPAEMTSWSAKIFRTGISYSSTGQAGSLSYVSLHTGLDHRLGLRGLDIETHEEFARKPLRRRGADPFGAGHGFAHGFVPPGITRAFLPFVARNPAVGVEGDLHFGHVGRIVHVRRTFPLVPKSCFDVLFVVNHRVTACQRSLIELKSSASNGRRRRGHGVGHRRGRRDK